MPRLLACERVFLFLFMSLFLSCKYGMYGPGCTGLDWKEWDTGVRSKMTDDAGCLGIRAPRRAPTGISEREEGLVSGEGIQTDSVFANDGWTGNTRLQCIATRKAM